MSIRICTMKILIFLLAILFFPNCSSQTRFKAVKNSWIDEGTADPIHSYDDIKREIDIFSEKLAENKSPQLNSDYVTKGLLALAEKKPVKANENFQRALKYDPRNGLLHMLNALTHQLRGEAGDPEHYKLAEVGYKLAARIDPGDGKVHYLMGVLQFKQRNFRQAQEHFTTAVMRDVNQADYLMGLAAASYYLGELGRAYANIERALSLTPSNPATLQASGIIYASLGAFDKANNSSNQLGTISKVRQNYLNQRIRDWQNYYAQNKIKTDEQIKIQLAQNLDIFGVPKGGMFDSTDSSNEDPLSQTRPGDSSSDSDSDSTGSLAVAPSVPAAVSTPATPTVIPDTRKSPGITKVKSQLVNKKIVPPKPKIKIPEMAMVDVAIIRTEEIYKTSKGVNLLNGLNIFFKGDQARSFLNPFGGQVITTPTVNDAVVMQLGAAGAGLTYSLNIFSDNYDRNEVIARPTILVEDRKKSSFFSGGTLHIVIEGGVAGSGAMQPLPAGVKLDVTPKFLDSDTIDLNVYAERTFLEAGLSQVSSNITGTTFATTMKTSIAANLSLRYGETMVISGLSDQEKEVIDDKVPGIGDLPIFQYLFRQQVKTSSKKTILVLLTPRRAGLSYETGDPIEAASRAGTENIDKLEKSASWMRPASNLKAFVKHLGKYEFFNHYRKGDMQLESWAGEKNIDDAISRTLEYLYIFYDFEKDERSEL